MANPQAPSATQIPQQPKQPKEPMKAKSKAAAARGKIPHKTLYSRVSYLYQAAAYLSTVTSQSPPIVPLAPLAHRLSTELRRVSLKTQIRLHGSIKHSLCRFCDALLFVPPISIAADGGVADDAVLDVTTSGVGVESGAGDLRVTCGFGGDDVGPDPRGTGGAAETGNVATAAVVKPEGLVYLPENSGSGHPGRRAEPSSATHDAVEHSTAIPAGKQAQPLRAKVFVENRSRHGKKPWADMLVVQCRVCGGCKRYPLSAPRQAKRRVRDQRATGNGGDVPVQPQD